jgi:toxin CcdB
LFASSSVVVAPLITSDYFGEPIARLNPVLTVHDKPLILSPLELTAVLVRDLGAWQADLGSYRDDIVAALDMLFTGI